LYIYITRLVFSRPTKFVALTRQCLTSTRRGNSWRLIALPSLPPHIHPSHVSHYFAHNRLIPKRSLLSTNPFDAITRCKATKRAHLHTASLRQSISITTHLRKCPDAPWRASITDHRRSPPQDTPPQHPAYLTRRTAIRTAHRDEQARGKRRRCPREAVCRRLRLLMAVRADRRRGSGRMTRRMRLMRWKSALRGTLIPIRTRIRGERSRGRVGRWNASSMVRASTRVMSCAGTDRSQRTATNCCATTTAG